jgi:hypothetical protein
MAEQPMNPLAGAAGPGMYSTRTDQLKFQSDSYGAGVENAANKAGAPMAKTASVNPISLSEQGMAPSQQPVTPLFAPTQRPDEPITAGSIMGAGPGPEALGINAAAPREKLSDILSRMLPYDTTGEVAVLYQQALSVGN